MNAFKQFIKDDLTRIGDKRNKSSCPAFKHDQFIGGGCQQYSSYQNQRLNLTELCPMESTPVYANLQSLTPVPELKCEVKYFRVKRFHERHPKLYIFFKISEHRAIKDWVYLD